ncbi:hypothetical protein [uncultured Dubosiella sp.]|uniref:hypothetical protein n=1 Tax=uncultured Dubosiella sp. TaxID=1937011 RepID=UPI00273144FB|nr:hypothetical protein [uncultured Dubosiella sp.]
MRMRKLFVLEAARDQKGIIHFKTDKQCLDDIMPENGSVTAGQFRTLAINAMNELLDLCYSIGEKMEKEYQEEKAEIEAMQQVDHEKLN